VALSVYILVDRMTLDKEDALEELVVAAAHGDATAWQRLGRAIEPQLTRIVSQPRFLGRLSHRDDDCRNLIVEVIARLRADDYRRLRLYLDTRRDHPQLVFLMWLRVVAKRAGIDYLCGHPDYIDRRHIDRGSASGQWIDAGTLPSGSKLRGERAPVSNRGTAQQLLRYTAREIPDVQRRALEMWVQSDGYDEIARKLEIPTAASAERMVRAAIERLRRKFRVNDETRKP
jgi:hypothetical protein